MLFIRAGTRVRPISTLLYNLKQAPVQAAALARLQKQSFPTVQLQQQRGMSEIKKVLTKNAAPRRFTF